MYETCVQSQASHQKRMNENEKVGEKNSKGINRFPYKLAEDIRLRVLDTGLSALFKSSH